MNNLYRLSQAGGKSLYVGMSHNARYKNYEFLFYVPSHELTAKDLKIRNEKNKLGMRSGDKKKKEK